MRLPKEIHVDGGSGRLCGSTTWLNWPEHAMTDMFARSLPLCEKCAKLNVSWVVDTTSQEDEVTNVYTTLIDYLPHGRRLR